MGGRSFCVRVKLSQDRRCGRGSCEVIGRVKFRRLPLGMAVATWPGAPKGGAPNPEEKERSRNATGNCEVVQRGEGFRLHCPRRWVRGCFCPLHGDPGF